MLRPRINTWPKGREGRFPGRLYVPLLLLALVSLSAGCSFLLPQSRALTASRWQTYEEAQSAFDSIIPHHTDKSELSRLGFDPTKNSNIRILTYLDLIERFMPNQSLRKEDLDENVRACVEAGEQAQAWEIQLKIMKDRRYGNVFLDIAGFLKKSHGTGWEFRGLLLLLDDKVVYKISSGVPHVERDEKTTRPLGPLQELDAPLSRAAGGNSD